MNNAKIVDKLSNSDETIKRILHNYLFINNAPNGNKISIRST